MEAPRIRELEEALLATWPPLEQRRLGAWHLGAARGVTGRANSVSVLRADQADIDKRIDQVERWYRSRDLAPSFRLTPLSEDDLAPRLEARGYRDRDGVTDTLVLDHIELADGARRSAAITSDPDSRWWAVLDRPADQHGVIAAMLAPLGARVGYASRSVGGDVVAIGTVVAAGKWASIGNLHTKPEHRGQGHARAVMVALHQWAVARDVRSAFLNVSHANRAALGLYHTMGFRFAYAYRYFQGARE